MDERARTIAEQGGAGSTLDEFLAEEGLLEEATEHAIKSVLAWQTEQTMVTQSLTKTAMVRRMETSRAQLDGLLDPKDSSRALHTLQRVTAKVYPKLSKR